MQAKYSLLCSFVDWHFQQQYPIVTSNAYMGICDNMVCNHDRELSAVYSIYFNLIHVIHSWTGEIHLKMIRQWGELVEIKYFTSSSSSGISTLPPGWPDCPLALSLFSFSLHPWNTECVKVKSSTKRSMNISERMLELYPHLFMTSLSFSLARKRESFLISLRAPLNSLLYLCFSRSFSLSSLVLPRFFP